MVNLLMGTLARIARAENVAGSQSGSMTPPPEDDLSNPRFTSLRNKRAGLESENTKKMTCKLQSRLLQQRSG